MKYRVQYEGYIIIEADNKEEAISKVETLHSHYEGNIYAIAEEYYENLRGRKND